MRRFDDWLRDNIDIVLHGLFVLALCALALLVSCGCNTYTVVPADYHAVPIKQTGEATYERAVEDATGWYVPDALMLELLDAK